VAQLSSVVAPAVASENLDFSNQSPLLNEKSMPRRERATLLVSVLIIAICALTYELIVATLSSYLLGDSVTQFSFTIGLFLFAMGIGALISRRIQGTELQWFVAIEVLIGLLGGFSAAILYAVFTTAYTYYSLTMLLVSIGIGACVGLEIPLLTRIVANRANITNALADVLSLDYLGSLIASLLFPIILLPTLGVTQTSFAMGLLNILVAGLNLYLFRKRLSVRWTRPLWWAIAVTSVAMVAGLVFSTDFVRLFEQQLYEDKVIYTQQSTLQRIVLTRGNNDDLRLFLEGNLQFSSRDEYRYHELLVHPAMSVARNHETVVVLGGGDGLVARELLQYPSVKQIIVVDLDPAITDLAQDFPPLVQINQDAMADPRVTIVNQDAYKFIEESGDQYPVVIIDLPDPNNESLSKLYSETFYRLLKKRLSPDGVFVTQAASPYFVREAYWTIAHTIESSGFHTLPYHTYIPSFGEWGFVIGTPKMPPTVQVADALTLRYLTPEVLAASQVFDPDIAEIPTGTNTLNNPILPRHYEAGWREWN
jgi:spermidine synthase